MDLSSQGSFVSRGKNDILATAIGKPDHPGRVRTAGRGVGLKKYFGGVARTSSSSSQFDPTQMMKQMEQLFEKKMEERVSKEVAKVYVILLLLGA